MLARLHENPSTPEAPWTLLLYSDEVTPGNPLATLNNRKIRAVYWSFLELGENALSREEAWITIMVEYSKNINKVMAGLSQVMAQLIKLFLEQRVIALQLQGCCYPLLVGPSGFGPGWEECCRMVVPIKQCGTAGGMEAPGHA